MHFATDKFRNCWEKRFCPVNDVKETGESDYLEWTWFTTHYRLTHDHMHTVCGEDHSERYRVNISLLDSSYRSVVWIGALARAIHPARTGVPLVADAKRTALEASIGPETERTIPWHVIPWHHGTMVPWHMTRRPDGPAESDLLETKRCN